jgi:hypothetical protein
VGDEHRLVAAGGGRLRGGGSWVARAFQLHQTNGAIARPGSDGQCNCTKRLVRPPVLAFDRPPGYVHLHRDVDQAGALRRFGGAFSRLRIVKPYSAHIAPRFDTDM